MKNFFWKKQKTLLPCVFKTEHPSEEAQTLGALKLEILDLLKKETIFTLQHVQADKSYYTMYNITTCFWKHSLNTLERCSFFYCLIWSVCLIWCDIFDIFDVQLTFLTFLCLRVSLKTRESLFFFQLPKIFENFWRLFLQIIKITCVLLLLFSSIIYKLVLVRRLLLRVIIRTRNGTKKESTS